jgi:hypothetical protein
MLLLTKCRMFQGQPQLMIKLEPGASKSLQAKLIVDTLGNIISFNGSCRIVFGLNKFYLDEAGIKNIGDLFGKDYFEKFMLLPKDEYFTKNSNKVIGPLTVKAEKDVQTKVSLAQLDSRKDPKNCHIYLIEAWAADPPAAVAKVEEKSVRFIGLHDHAHDFSLQFDLYRRVFTIGTGDEQSKLQDDNLKYLSKMETIMAKLDTSKHKHEYGEGIMTRYLTDTGHLQEHPPWLEYDEELPSPDQNPRDKNDKKESQSPQSQSRSVFNNDKKLDNQKDKQNQSADNPDSVEAVTVNSKEFFKKIASMRLSRGSCIQLSLFAFFNLVTIGILITLVILCFSGFEEIREIAYLSSVSMTAKLQCQRIFGAVSSLVLLNSGAFDSTKIDTEIYGSELLKGIKMWMGTLAEVNIEMESLAKEWDLANRVKSFSNSGRVRLKFSQGYKKFRVQEALNLLGSNLLPLEKIEDFKMTENNPRFILENTQNDLDVRLESVGEELLDLVSELHKKIDGISMWLKVSTSILWFVMILGNIVSSIKTNKQLEKELLVSYGFPLDDCKTLRDNYEQIRVIVQQALDRSSRGVEGTITEVEDSQKQSLEDRAREGFLMRSHVRRPRGSVKGFLWPRIIVQSLYITVMSGITLLCLTQLSPPTKRVFDQFTYLNTIMVSAHAQLKHMNLLKTFILNFQLEEDINFQNELSLDLISDPEKPATNDKLVTMFKTFFHDSPFLEQIPAVTFAQKTYPFFDTLLHGDLCAIYRSITRNDRILTPQCTTIIQTIQGDTGYGNGIFLFSNSIVWWLSHIETVLFLGLMNGVVQPSEIPCDTSNITTLEGKRLWLTCIITSTEFQYLEFAQLEIIPTIFLYISGQLRDQSLDESVSSFNQIIALIVFGVILSAVGLVYFAIRDVYTYPSQLKEIRMTYLNFPKDMIRQNPLLTNYLK